MLQKWRQNMEIHTTTRWAFEKLEFYYKKFYYKKLFDQILLKTVKSIKMLQAFGKDMKIHTTTKVRNQHFSLCLVLQYNPWKLIINTIIDCNFLLLFCCFVVRFCSKSRLKTFKVSFLPKLSYVFFNFNF